MGMQRLTNIFNTDLKKTMCNLKRLLVSSGKDKRGGLVTNIGMVHAYIQSRSRKEATTLVFNYDDPTILNVRLHK